MVKGANELPSNRPVHQPTAPKNNLPEDIQLEKLKGIRPEGHSKATVSMSEYDMKKVSSTPSQNPARKVIQEQLNVFKEDQINKKESTDFEHLLSYAKLKPNIKAYEENLSLGDWLSHMFHKIILKRGITYQATQFYDSYIEKLNEAQRNNLKAIEESLLDPQKKCFVKELISTDDKGNITKFTGEIKNGQYHWGQLVKEKDGSLEEYKGYFKDNEYDGQGILEEINEDENIIYKGIFENGKITKGDYEDILEQGYKYLGIFEEINGEMIFSPKKIISPQGTYEGEIKDDKPQGKGKIVFADGTTYEGDFENGKRHGKGVQVNSNGDIFDGVFENGKFLSGYHTIKETGAVERVG